MNKRIIAAAKRSSKLTRGRGSGRALSLNAGQREALSNAGSQIRSSFNRPHVKDAIQKARGQNPQLGSLFDRLRGLF